MDKEIVLQKSPSLSADQDYAFLLAEGRKHIEALGSNHWTDYNIRDPGSTILEALCYALTELGYRAGFPVKDLLSGEDGKLQDGHSFFTAKNILTQAPLTIPDYRKVLIDLEGIQNAWLFASGFYVEGDKKIPASEITLYADYKKDTLSYNPNPYPVFLSGLYQIILDLEPDLQSGDLNDGIITALNSATGEFKEGEIRLSFYFPKWSEADKDWLAPDSRIEKAALKKLHQMAKTGQFQLISPG